MARHSSLEDAVSVSEIQFYKQWWKGIPYAADYLEELRVHQGDTEARKGALGIRPEQLVTVRWHNFWKGLNK